MSLSVYSSKEEMNSSGFCAAAPQDGIISTANKGGYGMSLYHLLDEVITVETEPELGWILIPVCLAAAAIGFFVIRAIRKSA